MSGTRVVPQLVDGQSYAVQGPFEISISGLSCLSCVLLCSHVQFDKGHAEQCWKVELLNLATITPTLDQNVARRRFQQVLRCSGDQGGVVSAFPSPAWHNPPTLL